MRDLTMGDLPAEVRLLLEIEGAVLAGGAIRDLMKGEKPKDYDLFFTSRESAEKVNSWLVENCGDVVGNGSTLTARYDTLVIQSCFKNIYKTPWELIDGFDFKNVCGFVTCTDGHFRDIRNAEKSGEVIVNCIRRPLKELRRLAKYSYKGYDCTEAYHYILSVMQDKGDRVILMSDYYEATL